MTAHRQPRDLISLAQGRCPMRGFTLIELVIVMIVVGIIAAIAVARYIAMGSQTRIAAINSMASTLRYTAENVHVLCKLDPACDYGNQSQNLTIGGSPAGLTYGWLGAGTVLEPARIDGWINYAGFTASRAFAHENAIHARRIAQPE